MLNHLSVDGFKPFGSVQRAKLGLITVIFGPNAGGKSSIIQTILLLRQSLERGSRGSTLITSGPLFDAGSFRSLCHRHNVEAGFGVALTFQEPAFGRERPQLPSLLRPFDQQREVTLRFTNIDTNSASYHFGALSRVRYQLKPDASLVRYGALGEAVLDVALQRDPQQTLEDAESDGAVFNWADERALESFAEYVSAMSRVISAVPPEEQMDFAAATVEPLRRALSGFGVVSTGLLPDSFRASRSDDSDPTGLLTGVYAIPSLAEKAIHSVPAELKTLLRSVLYLGPLRKQPSRIEPALVGQRLDGLGASGELSSTVLAQAPELGSVVNEWFSKMDIPYQMTVKRLGDALSGEAVSLRLTDSRSGVEVTPADAGFGIAQVMPILLAGELGGLMCVEQPELHLHPRLQGNLADFFIATAGLSDVRPFRRGQWIIETHSEALMVRIQRRIREGKLDAGDVSVLFVEPGPDGSRILALGLDEDGRFVDEWPGGFFEDTFYDSVAE